MRKELKELYILMEQCHWKFHKSWRRKEPGKELQDAGFTQIVLSKFYLNPKLTPCLRQNHFLSKFRTTPSNIQISLLQISLAFPLSRRASGQLFELEWKLSKGYMNNLNVSTGKMVSN